MQEGLPDETFNAEVVVVLFSQDRVYASGGGLQFCCKDSEAVDPPRGSSGTLYIGNMKVLGCLLEYLFEVVPPGGPGEVVLP